MIIQNQKGGFSWYLVLTKRGAEKLTATCLEQLGFDAYLPMYAPEPRRPRAGKPIDPQPRPFLPGYLFVAADIHCPNWRKIYSTYGVRSLYTTGVGESAKPLALPNRWIEQLQNREVNGLICLAPSVELKSEHAPGAPVVFTGMRSADLDAVFLEPVDEKRVAILVSLFGTDSRQVVSKTTIRAPDDR